MQTIAPQSPRRPRRRINWALWIGLAQLAAAVGTWVHPLAGH